MPRNNRDDIDDEDDDRPRRRRRPRDDEDDDDRPRSKKKAGGPNKVLILALAGGGVLVFLGLVCAGLFAAGVFSPRAKAPVPGGGAPTQGGSAKDQEQAAKNRNVSQNNMKQISLGMHTQSDVEGGKFQGPFAPGSVNGGHSFRVGLLPYVEQGTLFNRIDLKQPWDGERNALITNAIVPEYLDPMNPAPLGTATPYRMFVGPGAIFEGKANMPRVVDIPDGTSNTILYVQATDTVPWAKPQELPFGPAVPLPPLGGPGSDGFLAAMADGSVRYVKRTIPDATLRALITKAGGEAIVPQ